MKRRMAWHMILPGILLFGFVIAGPAAAAEISDQEVLRILTVEQPRDRAIRKALEWIRKQQKEDGRLADDRNRTVMTSFGIMAHLAAGITFDDPDHGAWLLKSLRFVLTMQDKSGYFGNRDHSRMYGHGITTLMLAEALGMIRDEALEKEVRDALIRAVAVTVEAAQIKKDGNHAGGWRYKPDAKDSDMSLSGWQLMSLHAAQQVGIPVPEAVIARAVEYAKRMTHPDGYVGYQSRGQKKPALRGLGMLCFAIGREEDDKVVDRIAERIRNDPIQWKGTSFFYRIYYDAVGMSRARPDLWDEYSPILVKVLVDHQKEDGSWGAPPHDNEAKHGAVYLTSMCVLALSVDRHVLPAYQR